MTAASPTGSSNPHAEPLDALNEHVRAILTEATRIGHGPLRAAALEARGRRSDRPEPLPDRIAALDLQIVDRLSRLEDTTASDAPFGGDPVCTMAWAIALGCLRLADEADAAGDHDTAGFYAGHGYHYLAIAMACEEGGSPSG